MIGKGLDFPNVTLVGVLSVDKALYAGDFRSYERTFSLVTQVVGRGGRGDKTGRAILQTSMPDHYVLRLAAQQAYPEFYHAANQQNNSFHKYIKAVFCPEYRHSFIFSNVTVFSPDVLVLSHASSRSAALSRTP